MIKEFDSLKLSPTTLTGPFKHHQHLHQNQEELHSPSFSHDNSTDFTVTLNRTVEEALANTTETMNTSAEGVDDATLSELWHVFVAVVTLGSEVAMVVGGVVPYIPQFMSIRRKRSTKGFSLYVCLALLVANTLRILFWFGRHYETPLLIQSILMNMAMFALVHLCVNINAREVIIKMEERVFTDFDMRHFWQWSDFQSYVECIMSLAVVGAVFMYFLNDFDPFVEGVGFAAVFTEAMLGVPQFYRNAKNKSTYGMSVQMVLMWMCGDTFKTTYFYLRDTPPQFFICGALQVSIDLAILAQVWIYRDKTNKRRKSEFKEET